MSCRGSGVCPDPSPGAIPRLAVPAAAASASTNAAVPTGAGQFASEQQAYRCPSDTVFWVNNKSNVYHFPGTHNYGYTKDGLYMCEGGPEGGWRPRREE